MRMQCRMILSTLGLVSFSLLAHNSLAADAQSPAAVNSSAAQTPAPINAATPPSGNLSSEQSAGANDEPQVLLPRDTPLEPTFERLNRAHDQEEALKITGDDATTIKQTEHGTVGIAKKPDDATSQDSEFKVEVAPAAPGVDKAEWSKHTSDPELLHILQKFAENPTRPNEILASIVKSAFAGTAKDQAALGDMYRTGFSIKTDYAKAKYWYELAATQNNHDAQYCLSYIYAMGLGVPQDYNQARVWSEKAAAQNNSMAQFMLANLYLQGLSVEKDYNKAREWFEKAAEQNNNPDAQFGLALMYANGVGVTMDHRKARQYLEQAAEQEHLQAMEMLGTYCFVGRGGQVDEHRALQLWTVACSKGNKQSCTNLSK